MILVISGTNRPNSNTRIVAEYVYDYLKKHHKEEIGFFSLEDLPQEILHNAMYESDNIAESIVSIQENLVIPSSRWIIISPEYNGSIPGVLKLFIDAISIRKYSDNFKGKNFTDDEWIRIMTENPKLIERPIVVKGNKAIIGRPPEKVLDLL